MLRARAQRAAVRPLAAALSERQRGHLNSSDPVPAHCELGRKYSEKFQYRNGRRKVHGAAGSRSDFTQADQAATAPWPVVKRPILETLLKNYAHHLTVVQPLILHGPRGVGKRTLTEELMREWNKPPHITAFVNLSPSENEPTWFEDSQFATGRDIGTVRYKVEEGLEFLAGKAVEKGYLKTDDVLDTLLEHYAIDGALNEFLRANGQPSDTIKGGIGLGNAHDKWNAGVQEVRKQFVSEFGTDAMSNYPNSTQTADSQSSLHMMEKPRSQVLVREDAILSLALAQQLFKIQERWRTSSPPRRGVIAKAPADAATSYAIFLLRLISGSVQEGKFQPKLIINNLDLMRKAAPENPEESLHGALYHDSLLMQVSKLGFNHGCIPLIMVSSDSYYSLQLFEDHADDNTFISQEMLGWTPKEAAVHLVPAVFEGPEWKVINSVLGSNVRHLRELHSIWHHPSFLEILEENSGNAIEDCIDFYLGYLQVTAVDPAMEAAVKYLEMFAADAAAAKISRSRLKYGTPWRHPPRNSEIQRRWARLQLVDYIQALADTDFAVNYREEKALEFLDDPCTDALLQVGLFYKQREPPYLRPISRGIARCLVRWYVRERINFSLTEEMAYRWHRLIRGRYYRQLIVI
ncbi:hypothetical protein R1sor_002341 [Riccia sorocarpa]|uniref:ATPase dynein-related AAA domain-containing protein n=1 Tax=Riccia sorocarpa TaxID=122646 RepID=A0ABD3H4K3_9MARC